MNIKSKDFLERLELTEDKNNKLALMGLLLGAVSILLALGKSLKSVAMLYGIFISLISLYSIFTSIKEKRFYLKVKDYSRIQNRVRQNNITDIVVFLFGLAMIIYSQ